MNVAVAIRDEWSDLVVDPSDHRFLEQAVSVSTQERPVPSVVRDDVWYFPQEIVAGLEEYSSVIDFRVPCGDGLLTDEAFAPLLLVCKHYALLKMSRPFRGFLDLSTIKTRLSVVFLLFGAIADTSFGEGRRSLADQTIDDLRRCVAVISRRWSEGSRSFAGLRTVLNELKRYGEQKLLGDWFSQISTADIRDLCKANEVKPHAFDPDCAERARPPLPALYCGQMLERSDFYVDTMADSIIERVAVAAGYLRQEAELRKREPLLCDDDPRLAEARYAKWAKRHPWPFDKLPFRTQYAFPANTIKSLLAPLACLQAATMQSIALLMAFRTSEFLAMDRDCLGPSPDIAGLARLTTRRFKTEPDALSAPISWDVPDWIARCVDVQLRLGEALGAPGLWHNVALKHWGERLKSHTEILLQTFADQHYLDASLGGSDRVTFQRYRTSLAREIIVSPLGHMRLLQRILGHARIETTEGYARMNPHLAADMESARYRRIGETPTGVPGIELRVHAVDGDIPADALAAMIEAATSDGRSLQLLAPGIVAPLSDGDRELLPEAFASDAVRRDALEYAIRSLCRRDIRSVRTAYGWLLQEARRLYRELTDRSPFTSANAHEAAVFELVRRET